MHAIKENWIEEADQDVFVWAKQANNVIGSIEGHDTNELKVIFLFRDNN